MRFALARGEQRMDALTTVGTSAGTAALIALGKWFLDRIRGEGAQAVEEQRIDDRDQDVHADIRGLRDEMRKAVDAFQQQSILTTELRSSQAVVNTMTAKAMDSIATKQERHGEVIADHSATLRLLTDNVTMLRQRIDQVEKEGRK
jgi:hypothetical protein